MEGEEVVVGSTPHFGNVRNGFVFGQQAGEESTQEVCMVNHPRTQQSSVEGFVVEVDNEDEVDDIEARRNHDDRNSRGTESAMNRQQRQFRGGR